MKHYIFQKIMQSTDVNDIYDNYLKPL